MDPTIRAIFFLAALLVALWAAFVEGARGRVSFFPLSFALFVFPFMWDAFEVATD